MAWAIIALLVAAAVAALLFDGPVAQWVAGHPLFSKRAGWVVLIKAPGYFYFTLGVAAIVLYFDGGRFRNALLPLVAGALGGLLYVLLKWTVGRHRPVYFVERHLGTIQPWNHEWFVGGLRGIVREPALSFPSGHATLSFATAAALAILFPRRAWLWFALASLVAIERVLENAHFVSDTLAAMALGIFCAIVAARLLHPKCTLVDVT